MPTTVEKISLRFDNFMIQQHTHSQNLKTQIQFKTDESDVKKIEKKSSNIRGGLLVL